MIVRLFLCISQWQHFPSFFCGRKRGPYNPRAHLTTIYFLTENLTTVTSSVCFFWKANLHLCNDKADNSFKWWDVLNELKDDVLQVSRVFDCPGFWHREAKWSYNSQGRRRSEVGLILSASFFMWKRLLLLFVLLAPICGVGKSGYCCIYVRSPMFMLSGVRSGVGFWMLNSHHALFHRPLSPTLTSFIPYAFNQCSISCHMSCSFCVFVSTFRHCPSPISWENGWTGTYCPVQFISVPYSWIFFCFYCFLLSGFVSSAGFFMHFLSGKQRHLLFVKVWTCHNHSIPPADIN